MNNIDSLQLLGCIFNENYTNSKMGDTVPHFDWNHLCIL